MKKMAQLSFLIFLLSLSVLFGSRFRIELIPKAHSQTPGKSEPLPPPTDMPLPDEFSNPSAAKAGANSMPTSAPPAAAATQASPAPPPSAATTQAPSAPPAAAAQISPSTSAPPAAQSSPALPPPPVVQKPLHVENKSTSANIGDPSSDEDLPPSALPTPQELDPSLKFLSGEGFVYDPTGRRDPFRSYISSAVKKETPVYLQNYGSNQAKPTISSLLQTDTGDTLENYDVNDMRVVAILWDVQDPKAMLSTSKSKRMFMVHKRSRIGRNSGYIATIREGEVVVVELGSDGKTPSTRVLALQR